MPNFDTSGVPQGLNLGLFLFLIFINDLPNVLINNKLMFADDLKIYARITCIEDCYSLLKDINELIKWCVLNRLALNCQKCFVMPFTRQLTSITWEHLRSVELTAYKI